MPLLGSVIHSAYTSNMTQHKIQIQEGQALHLYKGDFELFYDGRGLLQIRQFGRPLKSTTHAITRPDATEEILADWYLIEIEYVVKFQLPNGDGYVYEETVTGLTELEALTQVMKKRPGIIA